MPTKKASAIKIPFPELLFPYSPVAKPMPPPPIQDVCEGDLLCVSFSCALVPYLLGLLEVYRYKDSFTGTDEEKTIAVGVMRQLMEVLAMSGCGCNDPIGIAIIHRINPETGQLEASSDGGETWFPDPQSPYAQATQAPPLGGDDGDEKRCIAANNVISQMMILQESYSDMIGTIDDLSTLIANVVVQAAAVLFLPILGNALVAFLQPIMYKMFQQLQWMLGVTSEQYDDLFTEENWDTLKCILYCNCGSDGRFTDANIHAIINQTRAQLGSGVQDAGANMAAMIDFWSTVGTNNAATIAGNEEEDCDDCDCVSHCGDADSFSAGTVNSVTENEDGTTTFNVSSVDSGDGTQYVAWGNRTEPGSPCCKFVFTDLAEGSFLGTAYQGCGSSEELLDALGAGFCVHYFHIYKNFDLTTPWTANIVMGGC